MISSFHNAMSIIDRKYIGVIGPVASKGYWAVFQNGYFRYQGLFNPEVLRYVEQLTRAKQGVPLFIFTLD